VIAATCPADVVEPDGDWGVRPVSAPSQQAALEAYLFPPDLDWHAPDRAGVRTDGVVIIQHGQLIYEHYGDGYTARDPHLAWSVSKTFSATLLGIAAQQGRVRLEDSVCTLLPKTPTASCAIRVVDVLSFASGLDRKETYENDPPTKSSVVAMLYGEGAQDMAAFTLGHPLRDPPGTSFQYSSGDANVVAALAGEALAPAYGDRFPWSVLFDPLGMQGVRFERDGVGHYVGASYLYASPRDMARLGLLWLHDGCWHGQRMLPPGFVADSTQVSEAFRRKTVEWKLGDEVQGRQVWLNQQVAEQGATALPWPDVPDDAYAAEGHWGQYIAVIPSLDLVVVRTGDDRLDGLSMNTFLSLAMAYAQAAEPTP